NTTFVIQLAKYQQGISEANIIVISEKELILVDSEIMRNLRTGSYMNQTMDIFRKSSLNLGKLLDKRSQKKQKFTLKMNFQHLIG
ncbi:MAG TPA: hypothetical protein VN370_00670, partial [Desulfitobacteriaceae bacterium]|nr:hypothetical protein [Desulfitobacteriaceae bacterium]